MMRVNKWVVVGVGASAGLAFGIVVSVVTDLPLAPEIGTLAGGFVGFFVAAIFSRRPSDER